MKKYQRIAPKRISPKLTLKVQDLSCKTHLNRRRTSPTSMERMTPVPTKSQKNSLTLMTPMMIKNPIYILIAAAVDIHGKTTNIGNCQRT
jgi:hypothetical protein